MESFIPIPKLQAVLVADDHAVVRRGLKLIIEKGFPGCTVGEASDGAGALNKLQQRNWDLLVLDLNLPDVSGFDLLRKIKARFNVRVLVFSIYPENPYATRALRAGADGYLSKDVLEDELAEAIRVVAAGHRYVSRALAEKLAARLAGDGATLPHEALSPHEYNVMLGLAAGKTATELAQAAGVSVKTISTYKRRILRKMGLKTNADLTRYAIEYKLLL